MDALIGITAIDLAGRPGLEINGAFSNSGDGFVISGDILANPR
jgi:hypothetical protein